jgi:hypothetical protein
MIAPEDMKLRELFELHQKLWNDPARLSRRLSETPMAPSAQKLARGDAFLARAVAAGLAKRIEAIEKRLIALEGNY